MGVCEHAKRVERMDLSLWSRANMGPEGQIVQNQSDLRSGIFAPDWEAMASSHRQRGRDAFELDTGYQAGGGAAAVQWQGQPNYRQGDLPGSDLAAPGTSGPALVMNDSARAQLGDPFLSQASQPAGT